MWKYLKEIGMPSKQSKYASTSIGSEVCFDKLRVAETFYIYARIYATVDANLVSKLCKASGIFGEGFLSQFYHGVRGKTNNYFFFISF